MTSSLNVEEPPTVTAAKVEVPEAFKSVNEPTAAVLPPIVVPSIVPPLMSAVAIVPVPLTFKSTAVAVPLNDGDAATSLGMVVFSVLLN